MRAALTALVCLVALPASAADNPLQPSPSWDDMQAAVIGQRAAPVIDAARLTLEAPARADDPALVPVRIRQPKDASPVQRLWLVVDENPAPVAGEFTVGKALEPLDFELRVRVNQYSDIRAVAELADGSMVMAGAFVKASGGCSAPAGKDQAKAMAEMGKMKLKAVPAEDGRALASLMIRHPNNSGLQRDQLTLLDIPAMFIQTLEVKQGDAVWLTMDGGISISEDPVFRFAVTPGQGDVAVHAVDSDGHVFDQTLTLGTDHALR